MDDRPIEKLDGMSGNEAPYPEKPILSGTTSESKDIGGQAEPRLQWYEGRVPRLDSLKILPQ